jgi:hypothetical protein
MNPSPARPREPRNWFYLLLNLASLLFVLTALAYALVPVLEQKAAEAGNPPPPSEFRAALRRDGWLWLLVEVAAVVVLALASMGLDRWRQHKAGHAPSAPGSAPPTPGSAPRTPGSAEPPPGAVLRPPPAGGSGTP